MRVYYSADRPLVEDGVDFPVPIDYINAMTPTGMPPHELKLKIGATVMLLRNIDLEIGMCNGARCTVLRMEENTISLRLLTGKHAGRNVLLPRIRMTTQDTALSVQIERHQFPLRLAFCMTVNKSQGQTFDRVGICLPNPVFSHGQLYVAFSRARNFDSVKVFVENTTTQGNFRFHARKFTRNVVYRRLLA